MYLRTTTGLIIKVGDYGESDKIITLYCPREGKFSCIAKGAKRSLKRFMNKLEPLGIIDIQYNCRYTLPTLDQAEMRHNFLNIRTNYSLYTRAVLIAELLFQWCRENDGDPELYSGISHTLEALDTGKTPDKHLVLFLIFLYARLGYQPYFEHCSRCGVLEGNEGPFFFSPETASITCQKCGGGNDHKIALTLPTTKLLRQAQKLPFVKTSRLYFSSQSLRQALKLYRQYGNYLLDREITSWRFLESL